jgi:hypothetical protein
METTGEKGKYLIDKEKAPTIINGRTMARLR